MAELDPGEGVEPDAAGELRQVKAEERSSKLHLPLAGLAVALVAVLTLRLGVLSVALIFITGFLLSAIPEFRYIVDGTVRAAASPEQRLAAAFPSLLPNLASPKPSDDPLSAKPENSAVLDDFSALPAPLALAFENLVKLIVRDFVENWYLLPAVSTGSPSFPLLVRSLLKRCIALGNARVAAKNGRETAVYLLGCVSMTIVRELNELAPPAAGASAARDNSGAAVEQRTVRRRRQTRAVAEEVILTLVPPSLANPDLTRSLLTEMLAVQLQNTVGAFGEDWINQTIVATLGAPPTAAEGAKKGADDGNRARKASGPVVPEALKEVVGEVGEAVEGAVKQSQSSARSMHAGTPERPKDPSKGPGYRIPETARELISLYLDPPDASSREELLTTLRSSPPPYRQWSSSAELLLLPSLLSQEPCDEDLASSLISYIDSSPRSAALVRLWTQLGSFSHVMQLAGSSVDARRRDAKAILRRATDTLAGVDDGEGLRSVIASSICAIEGDGEREQSPFAMLQSWLIDQLERGDAGSYLRRHQQAAVAASARQSTRKAPSSPRSPVKAPPHRFAAMELPRGIAEASARSPTPGPQPSLADFEFRRRRSEDGAFPEEGDMTEGFSLDQPAGDEDAGAPIGQHSPASDPSVLVAPQFSVSVTDISGPSAWDAKGNVKQKRDLEFIIAVEVVGLPGFIVTRKWTEVEKMDAEVHRLLGAGTVDSPRALLPSLPYKTADPLCRALEAYLGSLLREPRYASAPPVVSFFARERAGSAQDPAFWALQRGVTTFGTAVGEGVNKGFAVPANLAAQGFNTLSKGFGLPFGGGGKKPSEPDASLPRSSVSTTIASDGTRSSTSSLRLSASEDSLPNKPSPRSKPTVLAGAEESVSSSTSAPSADGYLVEDPVSPPKVGNGQKPALPEPLPLPSPVNVVSPPPAPQTPTSARSVPYAVRQARPPHSPASPISSASGSRPVPLKAQTKSGDDRRAKNDVPSALSFEPPTLSSLTKPASSFFGAIGHALDSMVPPLEDDVPSAPTWAPMSPYDMGQRRQSADMGSRPQSRRSSMEAGASKPPGTKKASPEPPKGRAAQRATAGEPAKSVLPTIPATPASEISDPVATTTPAPLSAPLTSKTSEAVASTAPASRTTGPEQAKAAPLRPPVKTAHLLTQADFDNIVTSAMAVLEAAYGLTSQWSMKRGVLRVLETVLRSSYSAVIKNSVGSLIDSASDPEAIAGHVEGLTESFWPDGTWWSSKPGFVWEERTETDKAKTKQEARRLLVASWDGLKLALGGSATTQAAGQLFDVLQGEGATILAHAVVMDLTRLLILL